MKRYYQERKLKKAEMLALIKALQHAQFGTPHSPLFHTWYKLEKDLQSQLKTKQNERNSNRD